MGTSKGKGTSAPRSTRGRTEEPSNSGSSTSGPSNTLDGLATTDPETDPVEVEGEVLVPSSKHRDVHDDNNDDDSNDELEVLRRRVEDAKRTKKRLLVIRALQQEEEEIASLRREIELCDRDIVGQQAHQDKGDIQVEGVNPPEDGGEPVSKRQRRERSRDLEEGPDLNSKAYANALRAESAIKTRDPSLYKGKSIKEHADWVYACNLVFRAKPLAYPSDVCKVLWAAGFLKGKPLENWKRHERVHGIDTTPWEQFEALLLNWVQTAANRSLTAGKKFEKAEQRPGQDVRAFATYLQGLEDQLTPYSEVHRLQHFLSKIQPEIRRGVASLENRPKTLDDMVEAAARIEENIKAERAERTERNAGARGTASSTTETKDSLQQGTRGRWSRFGRGGRGRGLGQWASRTVGDTV